MVTGIFEIAQSFQHKRVKKTKKTQKKTKMNRNKQQTKTLGDKQFSPCFLVKTSSADVFTKKKKRLMFSSCSSVQVFRCLSVWGFGFWVCVCVCVLGVLVFNKGLMTFWKVKRVTREGAQKWPKFRGVKPDIFKMAAQKMAKIHYGVNRTSLKAVSRHLPMILRRPHQRLLTVSCT